MNAKQIRNLSFYSLLLFGFFCLPAFFQEDVRAQDSKEKPSIKESSPEALSPKEKARRSKVVVTIGERKITVGEIEDRIGEKPPFQQKRIVSSPEKLEEFVEGFVRQELFLLEAEKEGFDKKPNTKQKVKQNSVQILIQEQFDKNYTPESITDEELKAEYEANIDQFQEPEMVRAAHILVKDEAKAKELFEQAKKLKPQEFAKLARENSEDEETKQRGGDLRYFTKDGKPPRSKDAAVSKELVDAAFALKEIGDVASAPIKVEEHFSILMKTGYRAEKVYKLEQVQNRLRSKVWRETRKKKIDDFIESLRKKYPVEVFASRVENIKFKNEAQAPIKNQNPADQMKEHGHH